MLVMFTHGQEREMQQLKFQAGVHGIDLDKNGNGTKRRSTTTQSTEKETQASFVFRDPSEYEKMPMEKRQKLTEQMMTYHKRDDVLSEVRKG